jgi:hypothetical protein
LCFFFPFHIASCFHITTICFHATNFYLHIVRVGLLQNHTISIVKGTLLQVLNIQLHYLDGNNLHVKSLEILLFTTHPCATKCHMQLQMVAYATTFQKWMKFGLLFN